ncbi:MAG: sigma-70 family RNA polymerase sigma factor [Acidobacteriota bacterium]|nr:sigma-70 family RNA polymerase sigma factor [Acidobacteriota bacterium]
MSDSRQSVTRLLREWQGGREAAFDELLPLVYGELRRLARRHMKDERPGHTLQATALVHEAYARLVDVELTGEGRAQFFALASRAMRNVLVDHARSKQRVKRGGGAEKLTLDEAVAISPSPSPQLIDLDVALDELAGQDERKARVIELSFFGGLTYDEIAELLEVSAATVRLDVRIAKAWLASRLAPD